MDNIDLSFATVISLLPYKIREHKPGLTPKDYTLEAADPDFSMTIIPSNAFYLLNPDLLADPKEARHIKVPVPAMELAESIVNDYVSSLLGIDPPDAVPGLFAVRGNYFVKRDAILAFPVQFNEYRERQNRWFRNLVDIADDLWAKTHSPISVSDLQRRAAAALELKRDWLHSPAAELLNKCPFCQNTINIGSIKCQFCHEVIDPERYSEMAVK